MNCQSRIYIPLCFYFIPNPFGAMIPYSSYLHSTMLLLYPSNAASALLRSFNLHSTMLLLYPKKRSTLTPASPDLHSTMLLLYPGYTAFYRTEIYTFTFHYASTLSPIPTDEIAPASPIYIPLCFYFIPRWEPSEPFFLTVIYIPLCFYFIPRRSNLEHDFLANLHSTMLLLYPDWGRYSPGRNSEFTFHYASTLSQKIIKR